jgi:hypothetical protein
VVPPPLSPNQIDEQPAGFTFVLSNAVPSHLQPMLDAALKKIADEQERKEEEKKNKEEEKKRKAEERKRITEEKKEKRKQEKNKKNNSETKEASKAKGSKKGKGKPKADKTQEQKPQEKAKQIAIKRTSSLLFSPFLFLFDFGFGRSV